MELGPTADDGSAPRHRPGDACPSCGAAFVGAATRCINCGHASHESAVVDAGEDDGPRTSPDPGTRSPRRALVAVPLLIAAVTVVVLVQQTFGGRFPGSETVTRTGIEAIEGAPTCQYGEVVAACVVLHLPEATSLVGVLDQEEAAVTPADGEVLLWNGRSLRLLGARGIAWGRPLRLSGSSVLHSVWLVHDTEKIVVVRDFDTGDLLGLERESGDIAWHRDIGESEAWAVDDVIIVLPSEDLVTLPVLPDPPIVRAGPRELTLSGLDAETGEELWHVEERFQTQDRLAVPHFVLATGQDVCLDVRTGSLDPVAGPADCRTTFGIFEVVDEEVRVHVDGGEPWTFGFEEFLVGWDDQHAVFSSEQGGRTLALRSMRDGSEAWSTRVANATDSNIIPFFGGIALLDDLVVVPVGTGRSTVSVVALGRDAGDERWRIEGGPTPRDGFTQGVTEAGGRLFVHLDQAVRSVDVGDGSVIWDFPEPANRVLGVGDRVIVIGDDDVWILDPPR